MADKPAEKDVGQSAVVDDDEDHHVKNSVHQRLRANSSIMQLKKLLGADRLCTIWVCQR